MTEFDKAYRVVGRLVQDFRTHEHRYLSPAYQEAEARKDFIDKFWKALGWDVDHEIQKNPYEQEVKVERRQDQSGARKRADYAFSTAPNFRDVRFFVEAKQPSVQIENADDYFQTIRYGWNSQNPVAVLTDFEQFHILDCRYKPNIQTALNRVAPHGKFHYTDYLDIEKFARIYWLFAREAVGADSLEKSCFICRHKLVRARAQRGNNWSARRLNDVGDPPQHNNDRTSVGQDVSDNFHHF